MPAASLSKMPVPPGGRQRFAAAYQVLDEAIRSRAFPGCAFGVLAGDQTLLEDALGHLTYERQALPVTPGTVFDLASLTKVVSTTALAMLLYQHGRLDLDLRLGAILPEFVSRRPANDAARNITIRHLLAHNSGLPGYVEFFRTARTAEALLEACLALELEALPGTRAEYSDPGFILLGRALEAVQGEDLAVWSARAIFRPLKMSATGFCPSPAERPLIPPTEQDSTLRRQRIQGQVQDENAWVLGGVAGHAGLFSSVGDLLGFSRAILGSSAEGSIVKLFHPRIVEMFAERQGPPASSRALGWDTPSPPSSTGRFFSAHSIGHLGYSGCSLWMDLETQIAVVLLTNRTWPNRKSQLIRQVRPAFHDAIREAL
jgi:serine-type D-Ala-D-Ala carboxypeptidase